MLHDWKCSEVAVRLCASRHPYPPAKRQFGQCVMEKRAECCVKTLEDGVQNERCDVARRRSPVSQYLQIYMSCKMRMALAMMVGSSTVGSLPPYKLHRASHAHISTSSATISFLRTEREQRATLNTAVCTTV